jgi:hypothetical protein
MTKNAIARTMPIIASIQAMLAAAPATPLKPKMAATMLAISALPVQKLEWADARLDAHAQ